MDQGDSQTLVSIIIPAFNQLEFCRRCVESLLRTTRPPYRLILVDNGSTDGVGAYFDQVPGALVVHASENRGFAGGVNLGLAQAEGHALILNSDTFLSPGWLERLESALFSARDIGMAGPVSNCAAGPQQIDGLLLRDVEEIDAYAARRAMEYRDQRRDVVRLIGLCLLIREQTWKAVGGFDERFGPGNYEDDDYCTRVRQAGYRMVVADDAFVFHFGGRTFAGMNLLGESFDRLMKDNRRKYSEKWGLNLPEPLSPPEQAAQLNRRAHTALMEGDTAKAIYYLKAAIEAHPTARDCNDLGAVLWGLGRHRPAYEFFMQALREDSSFIPARENARQAAQVLGCEEEYRARLAHYDGGKS